MKLPVVALVGRPNVGKSTIFNKIVGSKVSIIEDTPGVTRDRIYSEGKFGDYRFNVIDTGGIDAEKQQFNDKIKMQAEIAINESDVVLFVVDGKEGLTSNDLAVRDLLRKTDKRIIVVINKTDAKSYQKHLYDFYELGFDTYIPVSGEQGSGFYELMEEIVKDFTIKGEREDKRLKFSVVGRPNVGKSSLINALLNEDRVIVSDVAGTTRDAVDTTMKYNGEEYVVIDTAGMRKKGKIYENIEKYSLLRSMKAIDRSDVCLLVINAEEGIIEHDKHIAGYVLEKGKGLVIVVNKWDTVEDADIKEYLKKVRGEFQFLSYVPVVFCSALTKKRVHTIMPEIVKVGENINREIKTSVLNEVINDAYQLNIPPSYKGKRLKIYFCNQSGTKPPKFTFHVNNKGLVHFSYERYLENKIRESFDFEGTPIILQFKNKGEE
ncbi:MAG: ribosome biogenesis GTPase Der [Bacilli bacterium]|nr:ribosome biogenesis GTPase Der [Bacilli bacterium]